MRRGKSSKTHARHSKKHPPTGTKKQPFRGLDNTRYLDTFLAKTKIFQDLLGVSQESLSTLYEQASSFLQTGRTEEAKAAFTFLAKLNPFAADFWLGLGICHLQQEEYTQGFDAFTMAHTMDPSRYDCIAFAIECCVLMRNFAQAEAFLKQAVTYAKRHPRNEQSIIILKEAPRILEEIKIEQSIT